MRYVHRLTWLWEWQEWTRVPKEWTCTVANECNSSFFKMIDLNMKLYPKLIYMQLIMIYLITFIWIWSRVIKLIILFFMSYSTTRIAGLLVLHDTNFLFLQWKQFGWTILPQATIFHLIFLFFWGMILENV